MGRRRKNATATDDMYADAYSNERPLQRNAANDRERTRMRVLSRAFARLKTTLPWVPADTKLSKLDTLRLATCYIAHLKKILDEDVATETDMTPFADPGCGSDFGNPMKLTWPFAFNGRSSDSPDHLHDHNHGGAPTC